MGPVDRAAERLNNDGRIMCKWNPDYTFIFTYLCREVADGGVKAGDVLVQFPPPGRTTLREDRQRDRREYRIFYRDRLYSAPWGTARQ